jgi:hypothetical protein
VVFTGMFAKHKFFTHLWSTVGGERNVPSSLIPGRVISQLLL